MVELRDRDKNMNTETELSGSVVNGKTVGSQKLDS